MIMDPCWVCGYGPHEPTELHVYTTEAEALAWFARQPDAVPPPLEIDGVVYSYGS
jgi:hypothetical protein